MGAVNLGTARIVIIVALIVAGVIVLFNGFEDTGTAAVGSSSSPSPTGGVSPTSTDSPSPTDTPTQEPTSTPEPQQEGVLVAVFNGTDVAGLAGEVQDRLLADNYQAPGDPADAPAKGVEQTIVYYRGGADEAQNTSDATYLAKKYFDNAKVDKLGSDFQDLVPPTVTLVVVVGQDYADSLAA
jgi:hypothetical protein